MFPGFLTPSPPNDNVIYGQEFSKKHQFSSILPRQFPPINASDQNIKSKLSFHGFILEIFK